MEVGLGPNWGCSAIGKKKYFNYGYYKLQRDKDLEGGVRDLF
jgi:hypothetical protein